MTDLPKAILIDLDDTILDTTDSSTRVWRATTAHFAREIGHPPHAINAALDEARETYWADPDRNARGRLDLLRARAEVVELALQAIGVRKPGLGKRFADHYTSQRVAAMQPFPGALEAIKALHHKGIKLGLISNGHGVSQRQKVTRFELTRWFDVVIIEGEFGIGKPDPRVFAHALEQLSVEPRDAWMVGDHLDWEIAAPQALGIKGIWLDWQGRGLPANSPIQPDRIIRNLGDLLR